MIPLLRRILLAICIVSWSSTSCRSFSIVEKPCFMRDQSVTFSVKLAAASSLTDDEDLFEDIGAPVIPLNNMEKTWRYIKKPLLRIGSKGATLSHGNSLRQLLEAHTAVKVKINTGMYGSLEGAFTELKQLAEQSGAPAGIEMIQARECDSTILFGLPGTIELIQKGEFPPV